MAIDSIDAQGRPTRSRQVTDGTSYRFGDAGLPGYEYLRQGALAKMRYPSGREVSYTHDDLGRPLTVQGSLAAETKSYVQGVQYTAFGAVAEMRLNGTNLRERFQYSPERLQLIGLDVEKCANENCTGPEELLHLEYGYGTANNGNPREQLIRSTGMNVKQIYGYDSLNRIQSFREEPAAGGAAAVNEDYCYDRHGNRAVVSRPGLSAMTPQVASCSEGNVLTLFPGNRISGSNYDVGGELANDGRSDLRFDIEDRLRKTIPTSGSETTYLYDGDGKRVMKQTGTAKTVFVYDAGGRLAAEIGGAATAGTQFLHGDMLGSTRLVTNGTAVSRRFDYFPFGGELTSGETSYRGMGAGFVVAGDPTQRFTGKERDAETGLDYFLARYMSSSQGLFTSPDPFNAVLDSEDAEDFNSYLANPQSWNRYSYVWNNPLKYVDPFGETVYLVTYTTGNQHGDEEFRRAAETRAAEIQKQKGFDPKKDSVLVKGVKTKEDFAGALKEANALGEKYGQVGEVSLFAHAGRQDGPVFHDSSGRATQFSGAELGKLSVNWEGGACARFYGCNTGVNFAQKFANAQGVTSMGYEGFAYFSSEAQRRSGPQPTGPLYLINAPGYENSGPWGVLLNSIGRATASPMVRRAPRR